VANVAVELVVLTKFVACTFIEPPVIETFADVRFVNVPAAAVVPPIAMLLIVPAVAGLIVNVPVPVGAIDMV